MRNLIIVALLFSALAESRPLVNTKHVYYTVEPESPLVLLRSLNRATPIALNDQVYHGNVDWQIDWQFWWNSVNGYCSISRVNVTVDLTITLPKLGRSPDSVERIWKNWFPNLQRHEDNHKDHAITIAGQIENGIANLPAEQNCKRLEQKANQLGHRLLKKLDALNKSYDKRTSHGKTEGAWLSSHL